MVTQLFVQKFKRITNMEKAYCIEEIDKTWSDMILVIAVNKILE